MIPEEQLQFEREQQRNALLIKDMLNHSGWQFLENELLEDGKRLTTRLIDCDDAEEMRLIQMEIRAMNRFFKKIRAWAEIDTSSA